MSEYMHNETKEIYIGVMSEDKQTVRLFHKNDYNRSPFDVAGKN